MAVKLAVVEPLGTVTEPGTLSAATLLDNATVTPPDPAALESVTVHVDVPPGARLAGAQDTRLINPGARRDRDVVCELPL
ncbi:MAG: hypothetical protein WAN37_10015 [Bryobacteraceae bacterium]